MTQVPEELSTTIFTCWSAPTSLDALAICTNQSRYTDAPTRYKQVLHTSFSAQTKVLEFMMKADDYIERAVHGNEPRAFDSNLVGVSCKDFLLFV